MKILLNNEFSGLSTGYASVGRELLIGLKDAGFEVAEMAGYIGPEHPIKDIPWKVYPVGPSPTEDDKNRYHSDNRNAFGLWKFEEYLLDYTPDIVISIRDFWMDSYIESSPFRPYYNFLHMPTVDAFPQAVHWMDMYTKADGILSYSKWAENILRKQGAGKVKFCGVASPPPAAEYKFIPNKRERRQKLGVEPNALIIGTVCRNQKRKLFPDLIEAFRNYLVTAPKELAERTFLYLHTYALDIGYNIPELIKEFGVGNKVLFTYICENCQQVFPSIYQDVVAYCKQCHRKSLFNVSNQHPVDRNTLAKIYGLFDLYTQIASCEGYGIPVIEAASVGVQTLVTEYAGMDDFPKTIGAIPLKVKDFYKESETGRYFAVPDKDDWVQKVIDFLSLPEPVRANKGYLTHLKTKQNYTIERMIKTWTDAINSLPPKNLWKSPPRIHQPNLNIPNIPNDADFVKWCLVNVLGLPGRIGSYQESCLLRDLNCGRIYSQFGGPYSFMDELSLIGTAGRTPIPFGRNELIKMLLDERENINVWEERRWKKLGI